MSEATADTIHVCLCICDHDAFSCLVSRLRLDYIIKTWATYSVGFQLILYRYSGKADWKHQTRLWDDDDVTVSLQWQILAFLNTTNLTVTVSSHQCMGHIPAAWSKRNWSSVFITFTIAACDTDIQHHVKWRLLTASFWKCLPNMNSFSGDSFLAFCNCDWPCAWKQQSPSTIHFAKLQLTSFLPRTQNPYTCIFPSLIADKD